MILPPADFAALYSVARALAAAAGTAYPGDPAITETLVDILEAREHLEAHRMGLTTRDELVSLVLQHLITDVSADSRLSDPASHEATAAAFLAIQRALFPDDSRAR